MNNLYALLAGFVALALAAFVAYEMGGEYAPVSVQTSAPTTPVAPPTQAAPTKTAPLATTAVPASPTLAPQAASDSPATAVLAPTAAWPIVPPTITADLVAGKKIYTTYCFACHETGAAGAPKRGDPIAWKERLSQDMATIMAHVLNGYNAMPPRGGDPKLTGGEVALVIPYLVSREGTAGDAAR